MCVWALTPVHVFLSPQTRAQQRGAPLKKEGAYNTDLYYQEKDEGYGDVGVGQVGCNSVCHS